MTIKWHFMINGKTKTNEKKVWYFALQGYADKNTVNCQWIAVCTKMSESHHKTCTFASNFMILEKCGIPF